MFKKSAPVLFLGGVMLAVSCASMAQDKGGGTKGGTSVVPTVAAGGNVTIPTLIERYTPMSGSSANATSLVNGIRSGTAITLTMTVRVQKTCQNAPTYETVKVPVYLRDSKGNIVIGRDGKPVIIGYTEQRTEIPGTYYDCSYDDAQSTTFTPPTGTMGLGNVDVALALTDAVLTQYDISKPAAPKQLQGALVGQNGVLTLRAKPLGWGDVALQLGFVLK
jgi:hypothetical protein